MNSQQFYSSLQRELWESRSIYIAPVAVAGLFLFGFVINTVRLPQRLGIEQPYDFVALMLMAISFLVAVFYCLDALYGERRARSILFWKSLPVSDSTTVLSKMSIPVVVVPLVTFAITVAAHIAMLLLSSAILLARGTSGAALGNAVPLTHIWLMLFTHLMLGHGLWYAPIYAWFLLVSAWARRAPLLWAVLPPVVVGAVEKAAFNTSHFAVILQHRFAGGPSVSGAALRGGVSVSGGTTTMSMEGMTPFTLGQLLGSPGLWIGFAVAAAFLAAAVKLRRDRGPI